VPWGLLPELRGRPVTVAPSASTWLAAKRATDHTQIARRPLLVAGPDLEHAATEIVQLTGLYRDATVLVGAAATVSATMRALPACTALHIAAHGHHERQNPLFSRLDLVDGPLMAHDIHQLGAAPPHVVLSSCDVGRTVVRTGDELLGFTAALLYSGTHTVISSVARIDDVAAVDVMVAYHRSLRDGTPPARALATATAAQPLMPLVCFGCG
jgi:CHAT domain-containing protein